MDPHLPSSDDTTRAKVLILLAHKGNVPPFSLLPIELVRVILGLIYVPAWCPETFSRPSFLSCEPNRATLVVGTTGNQPLSIFVTFTNP